MDACPEQEARRNEREFHPRAERHELQKHNKKSHRPGWAAPAAKLDPGPAINTR